MAEHSRLRKNWDSGFAVRALRSYEECLRKNVELAISRISKLGKDHSTVAVDEIVSWFAFDFMSEVGFNRSFGNLKEGKTVPIVKVGGLATRTTIWREISNTIFFTNSSIICLQMLQETSVMTLTVSQLFHHRMQLLLISSLLSFQLFERTNLFTSWGTFHI